MTIERIFIDKLFAAEAYTRTAEKEHRAFEASKHIYDLAVIASEPRIVSLLQDKEQLAKLLKIRLTEEQNRLDGIPAFFRKTSSFSRKHVQIRTLRRLTQRCKINMSLSRMTGFRWMMQQYQLHCLQDQLNLNPAWEPYNY